MTAPETFGKLAGRVDQSRSVGKGRVSRPLASRFDADFVIHSESELLLAAKVNFRRLDGYMTEEKLDLVKVASGKMSSSTKW